MIPYGCLATGRNVGMIEVVRNAKTVMHILKQDIRSAMMVRTKELHSWIKEKNRSPSAVDKTGTSTEGYLLYVKFTCGLRNVVVGFLVAPRSVQEVRLK